MFKNYFKSAWNSIVRNRVYSGINIIGLTVGLCACLTVATVIIDDLSYDRQWKNADRLFRVVTLNKMGEGLYDRTSHSFAGLPPELKKNFPEVEEYSMIITGELRLKLNPADPNGVLTSSLMTDTAIWHLLDLHMLSGNPTAHQPGHANLVLTKSFADKFFRGENPIGKIIEDVPSYTDKSEQYVITGIIEDLPANSHLRADIIVISGRTTEQLSKEQGGSMMQHYVLLNKDADERKLAVKINKWYRQFVSASKSFEYEFQPIKEVYLHSEFASSQKIKGSVQRIYIFSAVAALLLLIACVNFINLATARSASGMAETGIRKILGATRKHIILRYVTEAMLIFLISTLLAFLLYSVSVRYVEAYLGYELGKTLLSQPLLLLTVATGILLISIISGVYPAWLISGWKPANTLKQKITSNHAIGANFLRKALVVVQFSMSIIVVIAMIVVKNQINFMDNSDVGYDKQNVLNIDFISWDGKGGAFKNELLRMPGVESASICQWTPGKLAGSMVREVEDPEHPGNNTKVWYISADKDFSRSIGFRLKQGRLLEFEKRDTSSGENKTESTNGMPNCLLTATTARLLHITELNRPVKSIEAVPVGILEDFHNESLHSRLGPTVIYAQKDMQYGNMLVKVKPGSSQEVMNSIHSLWRQFFPAKLLEMNWVEDLLAKQYEEEKKLNQVFVFFSTLSMLLAALGIFALMVHASHRRTKEMGVRKVLGATVASITWLMSAGFLKLMLISIAVASPIAWWTMNGWLQDFAYRVSIEWWVFAVAGAIAIVVALITISFHSIKLGIANPAESLRVENG